MLNRRMVLRGGVVSMVGYSFAPSLALFSDPPRDITVATDFDELWSTLSDQYCFFSEKRINWTKVREFYRPKAISSVSIDTLQAAAALHPENYQAMQMAAINRFGEVVRRVLNELYDPHTHLSDPPLGSVRWPLYDIMTERVGDRVRISAVKDQSAAACAGLVPGDQIVAINGRPVLDVTADHLPRCMTAPDPEADAYALNVAVAGLKGIMRQMTVRSRGTTTRNVVIEPQSAPAQAPVEWRRLEGGLGYVVIRHFEDMTVVTAFDKALDALRDTRGLVIDVRRNGGGDTTVAKPIMGRFIAERKAYARMRRREGAGLSAPWTEYVDPQGPFTYTAPVVVLTGHWSASMAEGFPMGMRGIGRATIVGTRMMRLGAAVVPIRLDRTGIGVQFSAEPVYDVQGHPRWEMRPDVDVAKDDDILQAGIAALRRQTS